MSLLSSCYFKVGFTWSERKFLSIWNGSILKIFQYFLPQHPFCAQYFQLIVFYFGSREAAVCNFISSFIFLLKSEYNVLFIIIKSLVGRTTLNGKKKERKKESNWKIQSKQFQVPSFTFVMVRWRSLGFLFIEGIVKKQISTSSPVRNYRKHLHFNEVHGCTEK